MRLGSLILMALPLGLMAQPVEVQYNPNSINPIPRYEQLYKLRTWRRIDLSEKQNRGFFAANGELSKFIIEAAKSGEIPEVYNSDSLASVMPKDKFLGGLIMQQGQAFPAWDPTAAYYLNDVVSLNGKNYASQQDNMTGVNPEQATPDQWVVTNQGQALPYLYHDINVVNLVEDEIFDKRRSRLYYDIQALGLQVFDQNTGTYKPLGWFKYKDVEKAFRNNPTKAVWFNRQNTAEDKNFADAFLLRLFHGTLYKIENPEDESIQETYQANGRPYKESVWASEWEEMKLMEKEHDLWEF